MVRLSSISSRTLDHKRRIAYKGSVDIYEMAMRRLRADPRPLRQLGLMSNIPEETLRDLKSGKIKSPRMKTVRRLADFYFSDKSE